MLQGGESLLKPGWQGDEVSSLETRIIHFENSYAHYARAGDGGPAVVVLHGWAASLKQWAWFLPVLANAGYTVYALDLLGHGRAPRLSRHHTIEGFVNYLCGWMKALNIQNPILLGHSMGGYLSLRYALDHRGVVRGLILVDPLYSYRQFYNYHQFAWRILSGLEIWPVGEFLFRHVPRWLIEIGHQQEMADAPVTLRKQVSLDYKRADPRILQMLSTVGDLYPDLGQVTVPSLVTWGCRDQLLSPNTFERLVGLMPAAQGHCFTGVGHNPHLVRAESFIELVLAFLRHLEEERSGLGAALFNKQLELSPSHGAIK